MGMYYILCSIVYRAYLQYGSSMIEKVYKTVINNANDTFKVLE